jgi:putative protease
LLLPDGSHRFVLEQIENKDGGSMSEAPGSGYQVRVPAPAGIRAEFGLLVADL